MAALEATLRALIEPELESLGFELVRLRLMGGDRLTLQIMAEKPDRTMNVDDCARVSRTLSVMLDERDPIDGDYTLEVSSPGIARPLVRRKDFEDFAGHVVKIELKSPMDGRKRFRGTLDGLEEDYVMVAVEGDRSETGEEMVWGLPFEEIADAKLVMTDELIAAHAAQTGAPEGQAGKQD